MRRLELWALVAVQFLFASNAVVGRLALRTFTPLAIVVLRISGAALIFWVVEAFAARRARPASLPFTRKEWGLLWLCALLGLALNQALFLVGLSLSTATNAAVVSTSIPVFTAGLAMLVGDERFALAKVLGIGLALCGAMAMAHLDRLGAVSVGDLCFLLNSLSFAGYLVLVRRLARRHHAMRLSRWTFAFAAVLVFPLLAVTPLTVAGAASPVPPAAWAQALWLVAGPTVLAYFFNAYALERVESSTVASFVYLQPLLAAAVAIPLLGERPDARTGFGAVLIFAGVLLASGVLQAKGRPGARPSAPAAAEG